MIVEPHPARRELEELLPEAYVAGGSFAEALPHPGDLPPDQRVSTLKEARDTAVDQIISDLLESTELSEDIAITTGSRGERVWPEGHTASLTHKGAIVLGAIAPAPTLRALGIDLELNENGGEMLDHTVGQGELPPNLTSDISLVAAFSVKEAVYKAFYPQQERVINFSEIKLEWRSSEGNVDIGVAVCPQSVTFEIRCVCSGEWVISAALHSPTR